MKRVNVGVKNFVLLLGLCVYMQLSAQPPQKMSYQAVVRDAQNNLVVNQAIGVRLTIRQSSSTGPGVYIERHVTTTNGNGLMSVEVGQGTPTPGSVFAAIEWGEYDHFLESEIDLTGGSNYTLIGTQQLITVPYAFYAGGGNYLNLDNRPPDGARDGDILYWSTADSSWHVLPPGSVGQVLTMGPNGMPLWYTQSFNNNFPPTITTDSVSNITGSSINVHATIVDPGTTGIISSGVCWSTSNPYPSIGNNHTADGAGIGSFTSFITNLSSKTIYYVRAYATNSIGTAYGQPISFTTPAHCGTVTDREGNIYQTVYIGKQCWMKENLRSKRYSNDVSINQGTYYNRIYYSDSDVKLYFIYNDDSANIATYGLLYTWHAMMNGAGSSSNNPSGVQGVCPNGWHMPSHAEWCELENYVEPGIDGTCSTTGFRGSMAKKLVLPQYWSSYPGNILAPGYWQVDTSNFNVSDFSIIPSGYIAHYVDNSTYRAKLYNLNESAYLWSCTGSGSSYSAYMRTFSYSNPGSNSNDERKNYALSVRCIKNE